MIVRIRFATGTRIGRKPAEQRSSVASGVSALMTPAAVATAIVGFWRLAADLKWADAFFIETGLFSHWQVWLIGAAVLQFGAMRLRRLGAPGPRSSEPPADEFASPRTHTRAL